MVYFKTLYLQQIPIFNSLTTSTQREDRYFITCRVDLYSVLSLAVRKLGDTVMRGFRKKA